VFAVDVGNISALRVQAYPDGGIARVRAVGTPTVDGLDRLRRRWEESS
jgi:allantoicase